MNNTKQYSRKCPNCEKEIFHTELNNCNFAHKLKRICKSCAQKNKVFSVETKHKMSLKKLGKSLSSKHIKNISNSLSGIKKQPHSKESKFKMSVAIRPKILDETKEKLSIANKKAWQNTESRNKYNDSLLKTKWIKVRTDKGQLELLEKLNNLGFKFEPNYQIKVNGFIYYIDGYDKEKNVVLEYDSKYHNKQSQKIKDTIREKNIIDILNPRVFWRYNAITNRFSEVHRSTQLTSL